MTDDASRLLVLASRHRGVADEARRLARAMLESDDKLRLQRHADELISHAQQLEKQASALFKPSPDVAKNGSAT